MASIATLGKINVATVPTAPSYGSTYTQRDGLDLIWSQSLLQDQMTELENDIRELQKNSNLTDTEKMMAMQMATAAWGNCGNARTNIMKLITDTQRKIVTNI
jgi:hypothetical protein